MKLGIPTSAFDDAPPDAMLTQGARFLVPLGRILFAAMLWLPGAGYFLGSPTFNQTNRLFLAPEDEFLVSILMLACGLSIAVGYFARIAACTLVVFLVTVTLWMHPFWAEVDPVARLVAESLFLRNLSLIGGALLLVHFGAGPFSADERHHSREWR